MEFMSVSAESAFLKLCYLICELCGNLQLNLKSLMWTIEGAD